MVCWYPLRLETNMDADTNLGIQPPPLLQTASLMRVSFAESAITAAKPLLLIGRVL